MQKGKSRNFISISPLNILSTILFNGPEVTFVRSVSISPSQISQDSIPIEWMEGEGLIISQMLGNDFAPGMEPKDVTFNDGDTIYLGFIVSSDGIPDLARWYAITVKANGCMDGVYR